jgi:hypothetical protein
VFKTCRLDTPTRNPSRPSPLLTAPLSPHRSRAPTVPAPVAAAAHPSPAAPGHAHYLFVPSPPSSHWPLAALLPFPSHPSMATSTKSPAASPLLLLRPRSRSHLRHQRRQLLLLQSSEEKSEVLFSPSPTLDSLRPPRSGLTEGARGGSSGWGYSSPSPRPRDGAGIPEALRCLLRQQGDAGTLPPLSPIPSSTPIQAEIPNPHLMELRWAMGSNPRFVHRR